jgi:hypothetical protein
MVNELGLPLEFLLTDGPISDRAAAVALLGQRKSFHAMPCQVILRQSETANKGNHGRSSVANGPSVDLFSKRGLKWSPECISWNDGDEIYSQADFVGTDRASMRELAEIVRSLTPRKRSQDRSPFAGRNLAITL